MSAKQRPKGWSTYGYYLIGLGVLLCTVVAGWRMYGMIIQSKTVKLGDGKNPASYGFQLTNCLIPCDQIVATGLPKDGLEVLNNPAVINVDQADALNKQERGKFLVPTDRVIGVQIKDEARAYPLRMLNWHEIVNDEVGGIPLAVTYSPVCDSTLVFDRRLGGKTLQFGFSGLLYNSNLLMYDKQNDPQAESLWSQLQWRAILGPAATKKQVLTRLPAAVMQWSAWRKLHPQTKVLFPRKPYRKRYKRDPYGSYLGDQRLKFPVTPLPANNRLPHKTAIVAVEVNHNWRVYPLPLLASLADKEGRFTTTQAGTAVHFQLSKDPYTALVSMPAVYTFWFAWYALQNDRIDLFVPEKTD